MCVLFFVYSSHIVNRDILCMPISDLILFFFYKEHVVTVDLNEEPQEPSTSTGGETPFAQVEAAMTVIIPADVVQTIAEMEILLHISILGKANHL